MDLLCWLLRSTQILHSMRTVLVRAAAELPPLPVPPALPVAATAAASKFEAPMTVTVDINGEAALADTVADAVADAVGVEQSKDVLADATDYSKLTAELLAALDGNHWSASHRAYLDVGMFPNNDRAAASSS